MEALEEAMVDMATLLSTAVGVDGQIETDELEWIMDKTLSRKINAHIYDLVKKFI